MYMYVRVCVCVWDVQILMNIKPYALFGIDRMLMGDGRQRDSESNGGEKKMTNTFDVDVCYPIRQINLLYLLSKSEMFWLNQMENVAIRVRTDDQCGDTKYNKKNTCLLWYVQIYLVEYLSADFQYSRVFSQAKPSHITFQQAFPDGLGWVFIFLFFSVLFIYFLRPIFGQEHIMH